MVNKYITCDWSCSVQFYNCLQFGERVDANRVAIQLFLDHNNGNTHIQQFENCSENSNTDIYGFVDCVNNTKNINHSEDIIEMNKYSFESGSDISHSLTSPRVIGSMSYKRADTSTLNTYSEKIVLDPMLPAMERTQYNNKSSFFGLRFSISFSI